MAMDLLKQLASSPLPAYFRSPEDIDKIRLLRGAGLVRAFVSTEHDAGRAAVPRQAAQVIAITQKGRDALQEAGYPEGRHEEVGREGILTRRLLDAIQRARARR